MNPESQDARKVRALKPKVKLQLDDYVTVAAWTRDSSYAIAGTAAGTLYWVDAKTLEITCQQSAHSLAVSSLAVSPEKDQIFSGGQDGKLKAWSQGKETPDFEKTLGNGWIEHMAAGGGADKNVLAVAEGKNVYFIAKDGRELRPKAAMASSVSGLAWHRQGGMLLAASYGGLQVFGVKKGTPQSLKNYEWKGAFWCCAWSPDGKWVAGATQEKAIHIWEAESAEHLHMPGYPGKVKFMGFTKDGPWMVTAAAMDLLLWDCSGEGPCGREPKLLAAHAGIIVTCAIQQQGSLFASADENGRLILWDATRPGEEGLIAAFPGDVEMGAASWSPDDGTLAAGAADGTFYLF